MTRETLILEFDDASAPLRKATTQEVVMRRFGGIGPDQPGIRRITVEYDDPRLRPERVDSADQPAEGVVPNVDPYRGYDPRDHDEWAV